MATHFARWALNPPNLTSPRLNDETLNAASLMPEHRRTRYLASRTLVAEMMFMLYGTQRLPQIITSTAGRPRFADAELPDFSIAYAGNMVGVLLATEGRCGLDMELRRSFQAPSPVVPPSQSSSSEITWINNQNDPNEARTQLHTLRRSILKLTDNPQISLSTLQLLPGSGRLRVTNEPHIEAMSDAEDILIWGCTVAPGVERLKLWEFDGQQGWNALPDAEARSRSAQGSMIRLTGIPSEIATPHNTFSRTS
ncbi:4'-phosphopantetheinyl transferase family protein [Cedecea sp.]|jgi:phosphopantetheinyl transferase|uniref:4'-phosphopantetheinyl transferase family protein n=1 Tax=Cedecea sp. TaxID=1970739 RepID=UPI0012AD4B6C|nr:hypothetical protein [Enterobacteriaceae bacterium RIT693]